MSDTPTARDTAALVDLMWLVMRRIWDHAEERLAPYSLSLKHNWALHALDEPMSMSALADRLGIDASYVTTIADQLEERGPHRAPAPSDRPADQEPGPDGGGATAPREARGRAVGRGAGPRCAHGRRTTRALAAALTNRRRDIGRRSPPSLGPTGGPTAGWRPKLSLSTATTSVSSGDAHRTRQLVTRPKTDGVVSQDGIPILRLRQDMSGAAAGRLGCPASRVRERGAGDGRVAAARVPIVAINPDYRPTDADSLRRYGVDTVIASGVGTLPDARGRRPTQLAPRGRAQHPDPAVATCGEPGVGAPRRFARSGQECSSSAQDLPVSMAQAVTHGGGSPKLAIDISHEAYTV